MNKVSLEQFIDKCNLVHNNFYDYSDVILNGTKKKVKIICPIHGAFGQIAQNHMRGDRCPGCTGNKKLNNQVFASKSAHIHKNKYDYSLVNYINNSTNVRIICPEHGVFEQTPAKHLSGHGCPNCGIRKNADSQKLPLIDFITRASLIHKNKYDYSLVEYDCVKDKVAIICPKHGKFYQIADNHLMGSACLKCSSSVSRLETRWLDSLNIKDRNKTIYIAGKRYIVDGFDSANNTVYEFYGDFWHGNPALYKSEDINVRTKKTFGELYNNTMLRQDMILKAGYNLVYIWENDFED